MIYQLDSLPADLLDQYGNKIPFDLYLLPDVDELDYSQIDQVMNARWYEIRSGLHAFLFASNEEIGGLGKASIDDLNPGLVDDVLYVDRPLKRWSVEDGFYHA